MKIQIIFVGRNKDKWVDLSTQGFLKKLRNFADISVEIIKEEKITKSQNSSKIKQKEGERILKKVNSKNFFIALDETGKLLSSNEFANQIERKIDIGQNLTFVIGGALGLSEEIKKQADLPLSFSKMTFTHQMIRPFLLEQVYRAFQIIKGTDYHK